MTRLSRIWIGALLAATLVAQEPPMQVERIEDSEGIPSADLCETLATSALPAWPGQVMQVLSGDTLLVRLKGIGLRRVRLAGLEAPEPRAPLGAVARYHLGRHLKGELVWVVAERPRSGFPPEFRGSVEQLAEAQLALGLGRFREEDAEGLGPSATCRVRRAEAAARKGQLGIWAPRGTVREP